MCIHVGPNVYATLNAYTKKIEHNSSYPLLVMIVSRSVDVFEMNDALMHTLGARFEFKSYHPKRQGKIAYNPDAYFGEEMDDIIGSSLL